MARKKTTEEILDLIKEDRMFKKLKSNFETLPVYQIKVKEYHKDLDMYHTNRPIRFLNPDTPKFVDKLIRANVDDQAYRSRIVAIQKECIRASDTLSASLSAFKDYILVEHSDDLRALRTKEERMMVIRIALAQFERYVQRVTTLKQCCDVVIKDIDQGSWSLKLSASILELHNRREMIV